MSQGNPAAGAHFLHEGPLRPGRVVLSPDESHHLARVRRVHPGQQVVLIDGQGTRATARLVAVQSGRAELDVLAVEQVEPAVGVRVTLAFAVAKGAHAEQLITQCTELGVAVLVPMCTERTVVRPDGASRQKTARWHRHAIEAAKQSGQAHVPRLDPVTPFDRLVRAADLPAVRLIAHPDACASLVEFAGQHAPPDRVLVCIGPEGGFTDQEVSLACECAFAPVRLGRTILRVETAAVAACAQIAGVWGV